MVHLALTHTMPQLTHGSSLICVLSTVSLRMNGVCFRCGEEDKVVGADGEEGGSLPRVRPRSCRLVAPSHRRSFAGVFVILRVFSVS